MSEKVVAPYRKLSDQSFNSMVLNIINPPKVTWLLAPLVWPRIAESLSLATQVGLLNSMLTQFQLTIINLDPVTGALDSLFSKFWHYRSYNTVLCLKFWHYRTYDRECQNFEKRSTAPRLLGLSLIKLTIVNKKLYYCKKISPATLSKSPLTQYNRYSHTPP